MSLARYTAKKKTAFLHLINEIVKSRVCYLFLAPYAVVFALFFIAPLVVSVFYSFTYFNILEPPKFIGLRNYINLLLGDDGCLKAMKNTFIMAAITGPIGYIFSFLFAWFINELPRYIRAVVTLIFYAPSISGAVYMIWLSYSQATPTATSTGFC
jgi:multiple sugar transport system permease protein